MEIEGQVQPLCSFDSFELIAINLTESNVDDNSISSNPFEINDMEAKEFGLKLRHGRRMKDFQGRYCLVLHLFPDMKFLKI